MPKKETPSTLTYIFFVFLQIIFVVNTASPFTYDLTTNRTIFHCTICGSYQYHFIWKIMLKSGFSQKNFKCHEFKNSKLPYNGQAKGFKSGGIWHASELDMGALRAKHPRTPQTWVSSGRLGLLRGALGTRGSAFYPFPFEGLRNTQNTTIWNTDALYFIGWT